MEQRMRSGLFCRLLLCAGAFAALIFSYPPAVLAAQPSDEYLAGYIAAILERELKLEHTSYRLTVENGVASITLLDDDPQRRAQVLDKLGAIDGIQAVNVALQLPRDAPPGVRAVAETLGKLTGVTGKVAGFPAGDVFRPLLADEKEPRFFVSLRRYSTGIAGDHVAAVGFGENFGLARVLGERDGEGLQIGISGGLLAQFDLDAPSSDLINADYIIGLPITYRRGDWSSRFRIYHQSSHLGDEFLLRVRPERINLSFESAELLVSYDSEPWRGYVGGEYLLEREPDLKRASLHAGLEYYANRRLGGARMIGGLDLKSFAQNDWSLDLSIKAGFEFGQPGPGGRSLRLVAEGFRGFSPHGQFFDERISYYGLGMFLGF
jgi:Protein of unknown function (DUF1207)